MKKTNSLLPRSINSRSIWNCHAFAWARVAILIDGKKARVMKDRAGDLLEYLGAETREKVRLSKVISWLAKHRPERVLSITRDAETGEYLFATMTFDPAPSLR